MARGQGALPTAIDTIFRYLAYDLAKKKGAREKKKLALSTEEQARIGRAHKVLYGREARPEVPMAKTGVKKTSFRKAPTGKAISRHIPGTVQRQAAVAERTATLAERKQAETERIQRLSEGQNQQMRNEWLEFVNAPFNSTNLTMRRLRWTVNKKNYMGEMFDYIDKGIDEGRYEKRIDAYPELKGMERLFKAGAKAELRKDLETAMDPKNPKPLQVQRLTDLLEELDQFSVDQGYGITPQTAPILFGTSIPERPTPTLVKPGEGQFTLSPEEKRFGAGGRLIAEGGKKEEKAKLPTLGKLRTYINKDGSSVTQEWTAEKKWNTLSTTKVGKKVPKIAEGGKWLVDEQGNITSVPLSVKQVAEIRSIIGENKDNEAVISYTHAFNLNNKGNAVAYWDFEALDEKAKFIRLPAPFKAAGWTPKKVQEEAFAAGKTVREVLEDIGVI